MATTTEDTGTDESVGAGWRAFQAVALVTAISYVVGWITLDPVHYLTGWGTGSELTLGLITFFSPLISITLIGLALAPDSLSWLTDADTWTSRVLLGLLLGLALSWMFAGAFTGGMYELLVTSPLEASVLLPFTGGVFLHLAFQHWFQSIALIVLAVQPQGFRSLTEAPTPAGLHHAVLSSEETGREAALDERGS